MAVQIHLIPSGQVLSVERNAPLQDALFTHGVEFPCGGHGRCKGCRIRVVKGTLATSKEDQAALTASEIEQGWRLGCRAVADGPLTIALDQWEGKILADNSKLAFTPKAGFGIAVDVGTTTLVAQLLDLRTGNVVGVRTAYNAQAIHGADIMSRIDFAISGGQPTLEKLIREQIGSLIRELMAAASLTATGVKEVVLVGNTAMHHLFCGIPVAPLAQFPFEPEEDGPQTFLSADLSWPISSSVRFLPCLGGFVGSDLLAGVLSTRMHESENLVGLIDLGTNGEIVIGDRRRMLCASTAAGPAFEGARISSGMRAVTGAISEVAWRGGAFECRILGGGRPRGICGSGLVDAAAAGLEAGRIDCTGKLVHGSPLSLAPPVVLTQQDIRELQLAKGAIAAGLRILLAQWGARADDLTRLHLAGAFGNYLNRSSARRIGLLPVPPEIVESAGNTALHGAKLALFKAPDDDGTYRSLRERIRHVALSADEKFQELFVDEMLFPGENLGE